MIIGHRQVERNGIIYIIRSAVREDAAELSAIRLQIDGETENMERRQGEGFISPEGFEEIIRKDTEADRNLFLVAEVEGKLAGFARCEGSVLSRNAHKVEFGICILRAFWGYGIGYSLLQQATSWADSQGIVKMGLTVLETNTGAISLYRRFGFETEGILKKDKLLADGTYYSTLVMGRFKDQLTDEA
ncbi:GNAT family N-acetyltransferase [Paenibacillus typhae]|uniref:Protein N-acetyltransferase, RimJ/RimL family n=1 Tax=Paenibacillus typhae TaxID=1174501 RepID=A0A1G9HQB9_9BACL|nr:GNAT family N-acetyltransferase [Paenibacillus typhae]SDL15197.1 Protein N-acetyltransferase, RimJ/RimL family [Paenibacillus typhae]